MFDSNVEVGPPPSPRGGRRGGFHVVVTPTALSGRTASQSGQLPVTVELSIPKNTARGGLPGSPRCSAGGRGGLSEGSLIGGPGKRGIRTARK